MNDAVRWLGVAVERRKPERTTWKTKHRKPRPELWPHLNWRNTIGPNSWDIHEPECIRIWKNHSGEWTAELWDGEWYGIGCETGAHPTAREALAALPAAIDEWASARKQGIAALLGDTPEPEEFDLKPGDKVVVAGFKLVMRNTSLGLSMFTDEEFPSLRSHDRSHITHINGNPVEWLRRLTFRKVTPDKETNNGEV